MDKKKGSILGGLIIVMICLFFWFYSSPVFDVVFGGDAGSDIVSQESVYVPSSTPKPDQTEESKSTSKPDQTEEAKSTSKPDQTEESKSTSKPDQTEGAKSTTKPDQSEESSSVQAEKTQEPAAAELKFRSKKLLNQHYDKHGIEMGFESAEEYEKAAAAVVANPDALHKIEKEDGDDVYYLESTNEFVIVSKNGYLRTYFLPSSGIKYYNKQ